MVLWHQHQPLYKDLQAKRPQGSYRFSWVRLHAIRDYIGTGKKGHRGSTVVVQTARPCVGPTRAGNYRR